MTRLMLCFADDGLLTEVTSLGEVSYNCGTEIPDSKYLLTHTRQTDRLWKSPKREIEKINQQNNTTRAAPPLDSWLLYPTSYKFNFSALTFSIID